MIAHSSFCNESVVISYGIVGAKIRKNPQLPNNLRIFYLFLRHFAFLLRQHTLCHAFIYLNTLDNIFMIMVSVSLCQVKPPEVLTTKPL